MCHFQKMNHFIKAKPSKIEKFEQIQHGRTLLRKATKNTTLSSSQSKKHNQKIQVTAAM